jgi:NAD(P)-dependent dehydrogenase (short-subunit alcohol dehydrogenase family)
MGVSGSKPHEIKTQWFPDFEEKLPSLEGRTVMITGTMTGTWLIAACACIKKGAKNVLLLNRPSERDTKAENDLKAFIVDGKTNVETIPCDLQDFSSVRAAGDKIKADHEAIDHVLYNNTGVMDLVLNSYYCIHGIITT